MANRVLLGLTGGTYALKVSKPGVNVVTAGASGLLLDTDMEMVQVVQSGSFTNEGNNWTRDVDIPNLGYAPFVNFATDAGVGSSINVTYNSNTSLTFSGSFGPGTSARWYYFVLNIPRG